MSVYSGLFEQFDSDAPSDPTKDNIFRQNVTTIFAGVLNSAVPL